MSVFAKNYTDGSYQLFVKGSPEKIKELSLASSLPEDFNEILDDYTQKGYRVIALAYKDIQMNYQQIQVAKREEVENNLIFLGFLIM
jgi:cation-transporting ATPase 13A2